MLEVVRANFVFEGALLCGARVESSEQDEDRFSAGGAVDGTVWLRLNVVGNASSFIIELLPQ